VAPRAHAAALGALNGALRSESARQCPGTSHRFLLAAFRRARSDLDSLVIKIFQTGELTDLVVVEVVVPLVHEAIHRTRAPTAPISSRQATDLWTPGGGSGSNLAGPTLRLPTSGQPLYSRGFRIWVAAHLTPSQSGVRARDTLRHRMPQARKGVSGGSHCDPQFGTRVRTERDDHRAATRLERGVGVADETVVPVNRRYRGDVTAS
jgi:hypothetical protein